MQEFLSAFGLSTVQWLILAGSAALIGLNKAGFIGISLIAIPAVAMVFGGRVSTGVVATFLVIADFTAVISYRKSVRFDKFLGLLPWTVAGMLIALFVGSVISDEVFKIFIAVAIILVLVFTLANEIRGRGRTIKNHWYVNAGVGLLGGFTTLIGNAAGPILVIYFLALNINKDEFIATRAWFFWIINFLKLPMHILVWKTITPQILLIDLFMIPIIVAGALLGVFLIKKIAEKPYRFFILAATFISALFLMI
ncbi:MAG: sulfite exporter TauE/SafE family protein [Spirochaetales bacterium]|uniref:Probable membrane transporter protein n=1 Tax=Candidatus Thalassospirochaeta sargassi TaxID=3119039 RepID=A0AAJ1IBN4_9SPIO|nr:sulfite exporter TauE/SafE family protein [Spirochaetales bacterium]